MNTLDLQYVFHEDLYVISLLFFVVVGNKEEARTVRKNECMYQYVSFKLFCYIYYDLRNNCQSILVWEKALRVVV